MGWIILTFLFLKLKKIVTLHTYSYQKYLVYMLEIPLFSLTEYHFYKLLPFPVKLQQKELTYSYIGITKEFILSDPLRQHYGKLTTNELTGCFEPSEFMHVCKEEEEIPNYTCVPKMDCEATLLHPSITKMPSNCEYRFFKLSKIFEYLCL
jgi:hypothetical protein